MSRGVSHLLTISRRSSGQDGILHLTASREDACEDYRHPVQEDHPTAELEAHLSTEDVDTLRAQYDDDTARV